MQKTLQNEELEWFLKHNTTPIFFTADMKFEAYSYQGDKYLLVQKNLSYAKIIEDRLYLFELMANAIRSEYNLYSDILTNICESDLEEREKVINHAKNYL